MLAATAEEEESQGDESVRSVDSVDSVGSSCCTPHSLHCSHLQDEESLNSKLCTFTVTQKEFMSQHWYHCHTCKLVDGVGTCSVCAKVCHKVRACWRVASLGLHPHTP